MVSLKKIGLIALDVNPPYIGGVVNSVLALAKVFNEVGIEVHLLTNKSKISRTIDTNYKNITFHGIGWFTNARSPHGSVFFCLDLVKKLLTLSKKHRVEIFNSHSGYPQLALATGIASKLTGVRMFHSIYSPTRNDYYFNLCDKLFAISKNIHSKLLKRYSSKVQYVGNGVDINRFTPDYSLHRNAQKSIFIVGAGRNKGSDNQAFPGSRRRGSRNSGCTGSC